MIYESSRLDERDHKDTYVEASGKLDRVSSKVVAKEIKRSISRSIILIASKTNYVRRYRTIAKSKISGQIII
jgi:hypothetical protein